MTVTDDTSLLGDYVRRHSEPAFRQVVDRHFDLVFSTALRMVGGDAHLAQDVAQAVFTDLARRAPALLSHAVLSGWLYRHTCFTAAKCVRTERRRQARERQAVEMNALNDNSDAAWRQLAPVLDEALNALGAQDRNAIVLRFFQHLPFGAIGDALGASEDGARKRVERALEKLRSFLVRRGVVISAALLSATLTSQAVSLAPAGLAVTVASASMAGAGSASISNLILLKLIAMTKIQITVVTALLAIGVVTTTLVVKHQINPEMNSPENQQKQAAITKMNCMQSWLMSCLMYAQQNNGQFPASLTAAAPFFPTDAKTARDLSPADLEILYKGSITALSNSPPATGIVLREKQAWRTLAGKWARTYGFADGHCEVHVEDTPDFESWENERNPMLQ